MTWIKICGLTRLEDALFAADAGAHALGFNFYSKSPRYLKIEKALSLIKQLPSNIAKVGIFVDADIDEVKEIEHNFDYLQFHGDESPNYCTQFSKPIIKAFRVKGDRNKLKQLVSAYSSIKLILFDGFSKDQFGGTGHPFEWEHVLPLNQYGNPVIISGGLDASNVSRLMSLMQPFGVDVCSRLEDEPGIKNHAKIRAFIEAVKEFK